MKFRETHQELVSRVRWDAVTCDFQSIKDPLDEALRTRFICSVDNEAVLKALFKLKDYELTYLKAYQIAQETKETARVAKETVYTTYSISQFIKWDSQSARPIHLELLTKDQGHTSWETGPGTFKGILWQVWEEDSHW